MHHTTQRVWNTGGVRACVEGSAQPKSTHRLLGRDILSDNVWSYRDTTWSQDRDLVGYNVEATDGSIGKIDVASNDAGSLWLVVDTGPWIFGKKRLIPAGAVVGVDHEDSRVSVSMTKDQIKSAPDYDKDEWNTGSRGRHTDCYTPYTDRGL